MRSACIAPSPTRADAFATGPVAQLLIVPMHRQAHAESKHFAYAIPDVSSAIVFGTISYGTSISGTSVSGSSVSGTGVNRLQHLQAAARDASATASLATPSAPASPRRCEPARACSSTRRKWHFQRRATPAAMRDPPCCMHTLPCYMRVRRRVTCTRCHVTRTLTALLHAHAAM